MVDCFVFKVSADYVWGGLLKIDSVTGISLVTHINSNQGVDIGQFGGYVGGAKAMAEVCHVGTWVTINLIFMKETLRTKLVLEDAYWSDTLSFRMIHTYFNISNEVWNIILRVVFAWVLRTWNNHLSVANSVELFGDPGESNDLLKVRSHIAPHNEDENSFGQIALEFEDGWFG